MLKCLHSQGNAYFGRNCFGADFGVLAHHLNNAPSCFVFTDARIVFIDVFTVISAKLRFPTSK
jgi:hypothetical protein